MIESYIETRDAPYVSGRVIIPRFGIERQIDFLLDTGADSTCLHPYDAQRIGVPFELLRDEAYSGGVGGRASYYREQALLTFRDGSVSRVYDIRLLIAKPTTSNLRLPSLLGRNIINPGLCCMNLSTADLNVARLKRTLRYNPIHPTPLASAQTGARSARMRMRRGIRSARRMACRPTGSLRAAPRM